MMPFFFMAFGAFLYASEVGNYSHLLNLIGGMGIGILTYRGIEWLKNKL